MTRQELCDELQAPGDSPPGPLLAAWERRRCELAAAAAADGNAKPVKLRLQRQLGRLDEGAAIAGQLRIAANIARYMAELEAERAKPAPRRAVIRLCLDKARPLLAGLADADLLFEWEKRLEEEEERLAASPVRAAPLAGTVLELIPLGSDGRIPTVRFVARPCFTLGRQTGADLPTRFGPETAENRQKTSTISRVNATLFQRGQQICVVDGRMESDGTARASRNGTLVDDRCVTEAIPLDFQREHRFKLGQFFFEVSAVRLEGCVRLVPVTQPTAPIAGAWLFSEATLGSSPDAAVVLAGSLPPIAARIQYREGGFWLAVPPSLGSAVALDRAVRSAGEIVPLQGAHELMLGDIGFRLQIH
jgi:hypothetical protein